MTASEMEFTIFCIENIAEELKKSGKEVYELLKNSNLIENYILPGFEALHTQSKKYIIEDIITLMKEKGLAL